MGNLERLDAIMDAVATIEALAALLETAVEAGDTGHRGVLGGAVMVGREAGKLRELLGSIESNFRAG